MLMGFPYIVENGVPCFVRHMAEKIFFPYLTGFQNFQGTVCGRKDDSLLFRLGTVVLWSANSGKALQAGDHHIILAERTVDDEQVSTFISATYDPHMLVTGIEYQIAGLGLIPRDGGTVDVLHVSAAAVAYDVFSIGDIVEYPIDESAAI